MQSWDLLDAEMECNRKAKTTGSSWRQGGSLEAGVGDARHGLDSRTGRRFVRHPTGHRCHSAGDRLPGWGGYDAGCQQWPELSWSGRSRTVLLALPPTGVVGKSSMVGTEMESSGGDAAAAEIDAAPLYPGDQVAANDVDPYSRRCSWLRLPKRWPKMDGDTECPAAIESRPVLPNLPIVWAGSKRGLFAVAASGPHFS